MPDSASMLKSIQPENRPRERLLRSGGQALSDAELVAILLRTGRPGQSALEMARLLLDEKGGLAGLLAANDTSLRRCGLAEAKSATLLAAIELGRRLAKVQMPDRELLRHPEAVARYLILRFGLPDQEVMGALYLDVRNRLIAESEVFRGTLTRTAVEPRAILKEALLRGASSLILFHTHPSGDPSPSAEDLLFTRRLAEAGNLIGVALADHLIVGCGGRWVSLARRGTW